MKGQITEWENLVKYIIRPLDTQKLIIKHFLRIILNFGNTEKHHQNKFKEEKEPAWL